MLSENARGGDLVARIGGDEFAVLCPGADLLGATELAERLRLLVSQEASAAAAIGGVSISIGVADWEGSDDSAETLMLRADRRLYRAKVDAERRLRRRPRRIRLSLPRLRRPAHQRALEQRRS